jgi:hypothetical protein
MPPPSVSRPPKPPATALSAEDFRVLGLSFEQQEAERRQHVAESAALQDKAEVVGLMQEHVSDAAWQELLRRARTAAAQGQHEFLLLRFPCALCRDGGRAINAPEADWPHSLQGEAAELFHRWDIELRPAGFTLTARVVDFPGGIPGHVGLFLTWPP